MKDKNRKIYTLIFVILILSIFVLLTSLSSRKNAPNERTILDDVEKPQMSSFMILNADKSVYSIGETVYLYASAIDEGGNTLCNCDLEINILEPGNEGTNLSLVGEDISKSTACLEDGGKTNDPDYQSYFVPDKEGIYRIKIKDINSGLSSEKEIRVTNENKIDVGRYSTTRLNPSDDERYHMILKITPKENLRVKVTEYFPKSLSIVWKGEALINHDENSDLGKLVWEVDLKAGETKELIYDYRIPEAENQVYSLGKLVISETGNPTSIVFEEESFWDLVVGKRLDLSND
ncbi:DUF4139 domain-containing protein [Patescibacteria group bacterium]|nr:DUF4139 domain-containing protein [Patescibacteria group bacterium]